MMEQTQENKVAHTSQDEQSVEQGGISVGHLLRAGRERMGWSIDDVVNRIKLAPRQIIALEADDFQSLPEIAFVRGFVRSYAKILQMDAQPLLDALSGGKVSQVKVDTLGMKPALMEVSPERRQNLYLLIGAFFIALLIVGFAIWQAKPAQSPAMEQVETVSESALVITPAELPVQPKIMTGSDVAATVVSVSKLRLVFDNESWTEITEPSGKVLAKKVYQPGEELNVEGMTPFGLVIGHASKVHLYYQGKLIDTTPYIDASSDVARFTLK